MPVNQLYTKQCPVCRELFNCVSSAGRYCSDRCRNKAYRRRKQLARDGQIKGVPKMYDRAIEQIQIWSSACADQINSMALYDCPSFAIRRAIVAVLSGLFVNDIFGDYAYLVELQLDLAKRHQIEMLKYFPIEESA